MIYNNEGHRVRDAVANSDWQDLGAVSASTIELGYRYFDAWYAEEIRRAKEEAWDEGLGYGTSECVHPSHNPYRKND